MASTFSPSLRLELIGDGDQSGIWGQTTNNNLGALIEQAIAGVVSITMVNANYTLSNFNGVVDEARNQVIVATGTNAAVRDIIIPLAEKTYTIKNSTTGGFGVRIIGSSGTGVTVPNGVTTTVYCDGINVYTAINGATNDFTVAGNAVVAGSITGTTATFSGAISSVSPSFTGTPTATTAPAGTNTQQIATTAFAIANGFPSGGIIMWSGSIASIPAGWFLCNGSNGTPDLRDRFVVGAGSTYAVNATGGTADSVVVSHTHAASVTDPTHTHTYINGSPNNSYRVDGASGPPGYLGDIGTTNPASTGISVGISTTGVSGTNANLPPYYALAYIMKA